MARILVIDDEPVLSRVLAALFEKHGHQVETVATGELAVTVARGFSPDLVVIDVGLPGIDGIQAFSILRERQPLLGGIFITARGSIPLAVTAMKAGAFDYLTKPFDNDALLVAVNRLLEIQRLREEVTQLREEVDSRRLFSGIVGRSAGIQTLFRMMSKIAPSDERVLIRGESGTGKELVARSLHRHGLRAQRPFVAVNCSAIPAGLVESEFFGHERGAFTDAKERRVGRFEQANGGTLFLDEIGDLTLDAQAKLLRVLEDGQVTRLGSDQGRPVDVRVIAATHVDLDAAVAGRRFREDLFYRLNVVSLHLPPLRERADDLPLLIEYFIDRLNGQMGRGITGLTEPATRRLLEFGWPGNVRQLENALRHAMLLADGTLVDINDLPAYVYGARGDVAGASGFRRERLTLADAVRRAVRPVERALIESTLKEQHGSRTATAKVLDVDRKTLFSKMREYELTGATEDERE